MAYYLVVVDKNDTLEGMRRNGSAPQQSGQ
jgi:hypothetical protein